MRRIVGMVAVLVALADSNVRAQQDLPSPAGPATTSRASGNPISRGSQWFRDKLNLSSSSVKDPAEMDGPPKPPSPSRSVMRSVVPRGASPVAAEPRRAAEATPPADSKSSEDLRIEQQVTSIEHMLKAEEGRLEQQVARFSQMREVALKKEDANALKQIEQMERQTVAMYQKRIEQILARMPATPAAGGTEAAASEPAPQARRRPASPSAARSGRGRSR